MDTRSRQVTEWLEGAVEQGEAGRNWWLLTALMRLLAEGEPVTERQLAEHVGRPLEAVRAILDELPSLERDDDGDLVGFGLTLRPTAHRFMIEDEDTVLYAFCAMDTLLFPSILDRTVHVESTCPATGATIRVTATPTGVTRVDPAGAVVSQLTPEDTSRIRTDVCAVGHFFASPEAARPWTQAHPDGFTVPIADSAEVVDAFADYFDRQETAGPSHC
ncbi:organomercurial lyase MerB [Glycomyces halotolerans]